MEVLFISVARLIASMRFRTHLSRAVRLLKMEELFTTIEIDLNSPILTSQITQQKCMEMI